MGGKVRKPYLKLRGKPILTWSVRALCRVEGLQQIVIVTRHEDRRRAAAAAKLAGLPPSVRLDFADGGPRRQDSVYNGLQATLPSSQIVLIHDAARPFPAKDTMEEACRCALECGGAILAGRVKDTVKREVAAAPTESKTQNPRSKIAQTVPRAGLWLAQTPQVFRRADILGCFERLSREAPKEEVTDDAAILERFGKTVVLVESSSTNLKITRPEDLPIAEAYLRLKLVR
jgi:2-C-methyl-D-erythritol 4-phosphate cytidylyltransferase